MTELTISDFPHNAPDGYTYEFKQFNSRIISIWLCCHRKFHYNGGESVKSIWGFYSPKKREYYSPINPSKVGEKVNIKTTRNYTAMPIRQTPLESAFS